MKQAPFTLCVCALSLAFAAALAGLCFVLLGTPAPLPLPERPAARLLDEGWFWGVGLEVTQPEPLPAAHPLWEQPRVLITPHAAGNSFAPGSPLERKIWDFIICNIARFLRGGAPDNQVDFETGYRKTTVKK